MADAFEIIAPVVRAEGKDVPPEQIQAGFNSLARQTQLGLNSVATDPSGPASGDLGGMYPAPTVVAVHATSGTLDGVVIGGTTPAAASFTTVAASTPIAVTSGGTGQNALNAHNVLIGEGSSAVGFAAPGTAGRMLISTGATTDPAFANNPVITGGTIDGAPIGQTTPGAGNFTTLVSSTGVGVPSGGTGRTTLTAHAVLVGEGTAAVGQIGPGTTGQMLLGATGADPAFGNNPTITGGTIDGAVIGGTTPAAGSFTTISATGLISPASVAGIKGTTTADNAQAGSVGEFVSASATTVAITTATATNVTSISLTAGDWEVEGLVEANAAATTTVANTAVGVSTTSATYGTIAAGFNNWTVAYGPATAQPTLSVVAPRTRINVSTTTTVFLVSTVNYATSTLTVNGFIRARRVR